MRRRPKNLFPYFRGTVVLYEIWWDRGNDTPANKLNGNTLMALPGYTWLEMPMWPVFLDAKEAQGVARLLAEHLPARRFKVVIAR